MMILHDVMMLPHYIMILDYVLLILYRVIMIYKYDTIFVIGQFSLCVIQSNNKIKIYF